MFAEHQEAKSEEFSFERIFGHGTTETTALDQPVILMHTEDQKARHDRNHRSITDQPVSVRKVVSCLN